MGTKFFIFCKTLPVSDVCPNCQKNQPISVVEEIIAIYFLQGYERDRERQRETERDRERQRFTTLKTRLTELKLGRRN